MVFHLALRQTEGFVASLISLMGLDLKTPDHTTLSRRNGSVVVPMLAKNHDGPIHLVIDSTGLKMVGDGEWHTHKHKTSNKRRSWRKLHLGVDGEGFIVVSELTESGVDDASVGVTLIKRTDAAIERIAEVGRRQWRKESGAHQQARAENGMFRYKRILGDGLRARRLEAQQREAMIGVNAINRMTQLGMPKSVAVAA